MSHIIFNLEGFSSDNHTTLRHYLNTLNTKFTIRENDHFDTRELATDVDINTFISLLTVTCAFITLLLEVRSSLKEARKKLSADEANKIIANLQKRFRFSLLPEIRLQLKTTLLKEEKPITIDLPTELGEYRIIVTESGHTYFLQGRLLK